MRRILKLRPIPAGSSALILLVGTSRPSSPGSVVGGFEFPVAVERGCCIPPAGSTRIMARSASSRSWGYVRGDNDAVVLFAASNERASGAPMSELRFVNEGSVYRVCSLQLRDAERTRTFEERHRQPVPSEGEPWRAVLSILPGGVRRGPWGVVRAPCLREA
jgi:hypothetical protein